MQSKAHIRALRHPENDGRFIHEAGAWKVVVDHGFDDGPTWTDIRYFAKRRWADALHEALRLTALA